MEDQLTSIQLVDLVESKTNPRKHFIEASLKELAESIKQNGLIKPVLVRPLKDTLADYELVDGARRFRASKLAGLKDIPAIVRILTDEQVQVVQLISFLQSEDIHPLDEAEAYRKLGEGYKFDPASMAIKVGKSESYVRQRLQMLKLTGEWKSHFRAGVLTPAHALLLARLQPREQDSCLKDYRVIGERTVNGEKKFIMHPVLDLRDHIERNFLLDLRKTNFNKKDPNLYKEAGSCVDCIKRTGHNKELFNDITNEDICTDPKCFLKKINNHLQEVLKTADADKEHEYVKISEDYTNTKGVLSSYQYDKAKKEDKGAKKAIVATGPNAGAVRYIKIRQSSGSTLSLTKPKTPAQIKKELEKKKQEELKRKTNLRIRAGILTEAKAGIKKLDDKHLPVIADAVFENAMPEMLDVAMVILGKTNTPEELDDIVNEQDDFNPDEFFKKMKGSELIKVIALMIICGDWKNNDNSKLAKATGVNYSKIEKQVKKEIEAEKKAALKETKESPAVKSQKKPKAKNK